MDCSDISCPYNTGSNEDCYECTQPLGEECEHFDPDKGVLDCSACRYFVNVGSYRTYCRLSRCIDAD